MAHRLGVDRASSPREVAPRGRLVARSARRRGRVSAADRSSSEAGASAARARDGRLDPDVERRRAPRTSAVLSADSSLLRRASSCLLAVSRAVLRRRRSLRSRAPSARRRRRPRGRRARSAKRACSACSSADDRPAARLLARALGSRGPLLRRGARPPGRGRPGPRPGPPPARHRAWRRRPAQLPDLRAANASRRACCLRGAAAAPAGQVGDGRRRLGPAGRRRCCSPRPAPGRPSGQRGATPRVRAGASGAPRSSYAVQRKLLIGVPPLRGAGRPVLAAWTLSSSPPQGRRSDRSPQPGCARWTQRAPARAPIRLHAGACSCRSARYVSSARPRARWRARCCSSTARSAARVLAIPHAEPAGGALNGGAPFGPARGHVPGRRAAAVPRRVRRGHAQLHA